MRILVVLLVTSIGLLVAASPARTDESAVDRAPRSDAPALPAIVTLREAAESGAVQAEGFKPRSYRQVHLRIRNRTKEPLRVDLCGSHLRPRSRGSCQRLGLGPMVTPKKKRRTRKGPRTTPPGTVVVSLKPGESKVFQINTCCLDAGKPAPRGHQFTVASAPLPAVREKVLRWWADNPTASQGAVNSAIWQNQPEVNANGFRRAPRADATAIAGHGGSVYRLRTDGELMVVDPDGIERFLGTDILEVYPAAAAVYAVAPGRTVDPERPAMRELWRLVHTGDEPWRRVAFVPNELSLHDLRVSPEGVIFATTSAGLYRVDVKDERFVRVLESKHPEHLTLQFGKKGAVRITRLRPATKGYYQGGELKGKSMAVCELYDLDARSGSVELARTFWNVGEIKAGPLGIYALTPAGKLRRLVGRSLRNAPGQVGYDRILAVGRTCVWLESKQGRIVATDKVGRPRFAAGPRIGSLTAWDLDRYSDAIVFLRGERFYRLHSKSGETEELDVLRR